MARCCRAARGPSGARGRDAAGPPGARGGPGTGPLGRTGRAQRPARSWPRGHPEALRGWSSAQACPERPPGSKLMGAGVRAAAGVPRAA